MQMQLIRAVLIIVGLFVVQGSSCVPPVKRPYPKPKPELLVKAILKRNAGIKSLRAEARMAHHSKQGVVKATVRMMGQKGGKLRFDLISPFDTPLATLVCDGKNFALVDTKQNRFYEGPASPCNLARLLQVEMHPREVLLVLGGSTPVITYKTAKLSWDKQTNTERLLLSGSRATQTIFLARRKEHWDIMRSEIRTLKGQVILSVKAKGHRTRSGMRPPKSLEISQPVLGNRLQWAYRKIEANIELPEAAFIKPDKNGLPSQYVDCRTELKPIKK